MITQIDISGFKGWKETGPVRLAPLTVFFGTNSSGKTSLLQFPLLLKQTANSPDRKRVLHYGDSDTPIDLGTYREMVYQHSPEQDLAFSLNWQLPKALNVKDPYMVQSGLNASPWGTETVHGNISNVTVHK